MKARFLPLFVNALAALGLAGCFSSDAPLFTDDQAVAPYAKITFAEQNSPEDKTSFTREGKTYVARLDEGTMTMRFQALGDNLYLAESAADDDGKVTRLYAVVKLDTAQNAALAYKVMAKDDDIGPGLAKCKSENIDAICIADVGAYVALAKAEIAAEAAAETTYTVAFE